MPKGNEGIDGGNIDNSPTASRWPNPKLVGIALWIIGYLVGLSAWSMLVSSFGFFLRSLGFIGYGAISYVSFVVAGGLLIFGYWWF